MKIAVLGAGFYGCHIGKVLMDAGHDVIIYEKEENIFLGASGKIPARLHQGFHYPRSKRTRDACQRHLPEFMSHYGSFARDVETNIYAIAKDHSMVDFSQYVDSLLREVHFEIVQPSEHGLVNVEGAINTHEQHIVINDVREYFTEALANNLYLGWKGSRPKADLVIDCTFCSKSAVGIDRYEPCVVGLLEAPDNKAVTIMDGPFGSLYPWNDGLCSLSSAKYSPISKHVQSWAEAQRILDNMSDSYANARISDMQADLADFYPVVADYKVVDVMRSIRAMPLSGADTRLVDIRKESKTIYVRAGKIDAVVYAGNAILKMIGG